jgi:hypothetical protein
MFGVRIVLVVAERCRGSMVEMVELDGVVTGSVSSRSTWGVVIGVGWHGTSRTC